jgi:HEAT repeat protein
MSERFDDSQIHKEERFDSVLQDLESGKESGLIAGILEGLSGLSTEQIERLKSVWETLDASYRLLLMQMLIDGSQYDVLLNYDELGIMNLNADESEIRRTAIEMLVYTSSLSLMQTLLDMVQHDEVLEVRIAAVKELGRFVLLGEYLEIPEDSAKQAQDLLLEIYKTQENDLNLRRFALESLANATRDEIVPLIEDAYNNDNPLLQMSAVCAMGNSCDSRWERNILQELGNEDTGIRIEAIRAAGAIQLEKSVPRIIEIFGDDELDTDERDMVVWSLGEIGGEEAINVLNILLEQAQANDDEDFELFVDDAISNAQLASDLAMLDFSDFDDMAFEDYEEE